MTPRSKSHPDVLERWRWLPTAELVEVLNLRRGMSVAAIGPGAGGLTAELSGTVGSAGKAFAIESPEQTGPIPSDSCDRVLIANLWAALPDPLAVLREAARLLRADGRLILVEWQADSQCPEAPSTRIGLQDMVRLLERNTWDIHRHGELGPHCYFLEAGVSDESVQS